MGEVHLPPRHVIIQGIKPHYRCLVPFFGFHLTKEGRIPPKKLVGTCDALRCAVGNQH